MSLTRFFNRFRLGNTLNRPGLEGETYLTRAVKTGDADMVKEFLALGADPDAKNAAGQLPLYLAVVANNIPVLQVLLETGANVLMKQNGQTLSEHAEKAGYKSLSDVLAKLEERRQEAQIAAACSGMMGGMMGMAVLPIMPKPPKPDLPKPPKT